MCSRDANNKLASSNNCHSGNVPPPPPPPVGGGTPPAGAAGGSGGAATTVRAAATLVAEPIPLVTTTEYVVPLSAATVNGGVVYDGEVAPGMGVPLRRH